MNPNLNIHPHPKLNSTFSGSVLKNLHSKFPKNFIAIGVKYLLESFFDLISNYLSTWILTAIQMVAALLYLMIPEILTLSCLTCM